MARVHLCHTSSLLSDSDTSCPESPQHICVGTYIGAHRLNSVQLQRTGAAMLLLRKTWQYWYCLTSGDWAPKRLPLIRYKRVHWDFHELLLQPGPPCPSPREEFGFKFFILKQLFCLFLEIHSQTIIKKHQSFAYWNKNSHLFFKEPCKLRWAAFNFSHIRKIRFRDFMWFFFKVAAWEFKLSYFLSNLKIHLILSHSLLRLSLKAKDFNWQEEKTPTLLIVKYNW